MQSPFANKAVAVNVMSRDELRPIFQSKKNTWSDGTRAIPFNLPPDNAIRQAFDAAVLNLDPASMPRYWIDSKIRGAEPPPRTIPSAALMLKIVSKMPGAVGYIEASAADDRVKVIARIINGQVTKP
jgi:ABC-type phosphate transport system substrate-binding protein